MKFARIYSAALFNGAALSALIIILAGCEGEPPTLQERVRAAEVLVENGDAGGGIAALETLNDKNPGRADILNPLAYAYAANGEDLKAGLAYAEIGKLPGQEHAFLMAAESFNRAGDPRTAVAQYETYLEAAPTDVAVWEELAAYARDHDMPGVRVNALKRAMQYDPSAETANKIGDAHREQKNEEAAWRYYSYAIQKGDEAAAAKGWLGMLAMHMDIGNMGTVSQIVNKVEKDFPGEARSPVVADAKKALADWQANKGGTPIANNTPPKPQESEPEEPEPTEPEEEEPAEIASAGDDAPAEPTEGSTPVEPDEADPDPEGTVATATETPEPEETLAATGSGTADIGDAEGTADTTDAEEPVVTASTTEESDATVAADTSELATGEPATASGAASTGGRPVKLDEYAELVAQGSRSGTNADTGAAASNRKKPATGTIPEEPTATAGTAEDLDIEDELMLAAAGAGLRESDASGGAATVSGDAPQPQARSRYYDLYTRALELREEGSAKESVKLLTELLARDDSEAAIWHELARSYFQDGQYRAAEFMALESMRRAPKNIAHVMTYLSAAQYNMAPQELFRVIKEQKEKHPRSAGLTLLLARAFRDIKDNPTYAASYYQEFLNMAPNHPQAGEVRQELAALPL